MTDLPADIVYRAPTGHMCCVCLLPHREREDVMCEVCLTKVLSMQRAEGVAWATSKTRRKLELRKWNVPPQVSIRAAPKPSGAPPS